MAISFKRNVNAVFVDYLYFVKTIKNGCSLIYILILDFPFICKNHLK